MPEPKNPESEVTRLEQLWSGEFGDAYVERNRNAEDRREAYWRTVMERYKPSRVLEVGCNRGANLKWIAERLAPERVYGVDINAKALDELRAALPRVNALWSQARELPFRDGWFDLTFTMGVLIHQPPGVLPLVMGEVVRCSRRFVICGEYYADELTEIPYRGQTAALFKRDFGSLYQQLFPELVLREHGFLGQADGWDDVTYWVFEKPA